MDYTDLLLSKGFSLNIYPDGRYWELIVEDNEPLKIRLCDIFGAEIELCADGTDIGTLILQCGEDFSGCLFYYDCDWFEMSTEEFMKCVEGM